MSDGAGSNMPGWVWPATFLTTFFLFVFIYVATVASERSVQETLMDERVSNFQFSQDLERKSWEMALERPFVQELAGRLAKRIELSKTIVDGKEGALERLWVNAPENLEAMGLLIDYRLYFMLQLSPLVLLFAFPVIIDAAMQRKKGMYRNSFSSPLRHTIGGRVIALPFSYLTFGAFFVPIAIPVYLFLVFLGIKLSGWWMWVVYLPKRI
jgi:hypothetical protein